MKHDELRQTWKPGDLWETKVDGQDIWVPVGDHGRAEPVWDEYQEYRKARYQMKEFGIHDPIEHVKAVNEAFLSHQPIEIDGQMVLVTEFVVLYTPKWNVFVRYEAVHDRSSQPDTV